MGGSQCDTVWFTLWGPAGINVQSTVLKCVYTGVLQSTGPFVQKF